MWFQSRIFAWSLVIPSSLSLATAIPHSARDGAQPKYPELLHATIEDLAEGLKHELFTSVDLVKVGALTIFILSVHQY